MEKWTLGKLAKYTESILQNTRIHRQEMVSLYMILFCCWWISGGKIQITLYGKKAKKRKFNEMMIMVERVEGLGVLMKNFFGT